MAKRKWRLFFGCAAALLALGTPTVSPASDFKPAACVDTTPHKIRMVRVAPGVELQVLDWGGKGPWMVFLTGGGDNAHVYDQFAYQFTDYFHVIGITRRGYLPSSQPRDGYDIPTRAKDDIAVLDAFGIRKAVFVGHSAAGMELSRLGQAFTGAGREAGLSRRCRSVATRCGDAASSRPGRTYTDADLASLGAYGAAQARLQAIRPPVASVCLGVSFDQGRNRRIPPRRTGSPKKIDASVRAQPLQDWSRITAPRLGIYAPYTATDRQAWYWYLSPGQASRVRPGLARHPRLVPANDRAVRREQRGQYPHAARRAALRLHQQRGRGRALDAGVPEDTAEWP